MPVARTSHRTAGTNQPGPLKRRLQQALQELFAPAANATPARSAANSVIAQEVLQCRLRFNPLDLAQQPHALVRGRKGSRRFARIHKRKRIPLPVGHEFPREFTFPFCGEPFRDASRDNWKAGMFAHAPPPVFRVPVVRLAPVHDGVDQTAVRILDSLGNCVSRIQVIMPKQDQRPDHLSALQR